MSKIPKKIADILADYDRRIKRLEDLSKFLARGGKKRVECEDWLRDVLKDGPVAAEEMFELASQAGYGKILVQDVKRSIGVSSLRRSDGWYWVL
jgi:hypothetical protein